MASNNEAKVKFTAETTEFNSAIKEANTEITNLKSQLALAEATFKNTGDSTEYLTTKQSLLKAELEANQQKQEALNGKIEAAKSIYGENSTEVSKLETQLNKVKTEEQNLESQLNDTNNELDEASDATGDVADASDDMADAVDDAGDAADDADGKFSTWKVTLGNLASDAISAVIDKTKELAKEVVELGTDFTAAMSEVQAISGATDEEMEILTATAREYGSTTVFSATEAAEALKYMSLAGWDVEESTSALSGVLDLAAASGMGLADASDMVTDYLSAFGMEASDATYFADMLAYAQSNSNTTAEQLGEAYKNCAANLNAAGQDVETVTALLEAMANQGTKGSEAGTALKAVMRDITSSMFEVEEAAGAAAYAEAGYSSVTGDLNDVLGLQAIAIGDVLIPVADAEGNYRDLTDILKDVETATDGLGTAEKAAAIQTVFTSDSTNALNEIFTEGVDNIAEYEEELRNADGAASNMSATMNDNLSGDLKAMNSAFEELGLKIFDGLEDPLRSGVQFITDSVIPGVSDLIDGIGEFATDVGEFGDSVYSFATEVAGPAIADFASDAIGNIGDFASELGGDVLTGLETLADTTGEKLGEVKDFFSENLNSAGETVSETMGNISVWFTEHLDSASETVSNTLSDVSGWFTEHLNSAADTASEKLGDIKDFFAEKLDAASEKASGVLEDVSGWFTEYLGGASETASEELESINTFFSSNLDAVGEYASSTLENVSTLFTEHLTNSDETTSEKLSAIKDCFSDQLGNAYSLATTMLTNTSEFFSTNMGIADEAVSTALGNIDEAFGTDLGSAYDTAKEKLSDIKGFFTDNMKAANTKVSTALTTIKSGFSTKLGTAYTTVSTKMGNIYTKIKDKMDDAKTKVSTVVDAIKGFFNFTFTWPNIPLPHFSITPVGWKIGDLLQGSIPSLGISWYAEGAVLDGATIFGMSGGNLLGGGEAGPEAVAPIETLQDYVQSAVESVISDSMTVLADAIEALAARPVQLYVNGRNFATATSGDYDFAMGMRQNLTARELSLA